MCVASNYNYDKLIMIQINYYFLSGLTHHNGHRYSLNLLNSRDFKNNFLGPLSLSLSLSWDLTAHRKVLTTFEI